MLTFAGIDLGLEPVLDDTTVCRFRYLLKTKQLGQPLFETAYAHL